MNFSNSSCEAYVDTLSSGFTALVSLTYFILFAIGCILHFIVLVAIAKNPKEFSSPYYKYIVNLAVGKLMYTIYYGIFGAFCTALS